MTEPTRHIHNDWLCPAHPCGPKGSEQACPEGDYDVTACNPYWNGCPDGAPEIEWVLLQ